jgi:regulatory protein
MIENTAVAVSSRIPARRAEKQATDAPVAVDAAVIERWALSYLERFASSAENLRRVLLRRVRRRASPEAVHDAAPLIDVLVARYRDSGLLDDVAYAVGRARSRLRRGQSLRTVRAALAIKGVAAEDAAAALDALAEDAANLDLAAACAYARRRRLGPFRGGAAAPGPARQRELAAFARAGFSRRDAESVLACASPEALAELLAGDRT